MSFPFFPWDPCIFVFYVKAIFLSSVSPLNFYIFCKVFLLSYLPSISSLFLLWCACIFLQGHLYFSRKDFIFSYFPSVSSLYLRCPFAFSVKVISCDVPVFSYFPSISSSFLPYCPRIFVFLTYRIFSSSMSSLYLHIFVHALWSARITTFTILWKQFCLSNHRIY